ncbi:RRP6-like protein 3 isoform X1 [Tanacetum coccineum]
MHPYESAIKALLEKPQLDVKFSNGTMGDMKDAYVWVHDEEKLKQLVEVLSNERVFAVDTEQFAGIMKNIISTRDEDYLVDTIALHDVMGNPSAIMYLPIPIYASVVKSEKRERLSEEAKRSTQKRFDSKEARRFTRAIKSVFHGANNDVIWLQRDFHIYVVNLFDTPNACDVLSKPHRSLAYLLETYCGVITNKFYQREDWRQCPLPKDMLEYARMDVHYLLYIADCLVAELKLQKKMVRSVSLPLSISNDLSKSENLASLDDNKFNFVYEASRRSNVVCLQLFTKELEASPGYFRVLSDAYAVGGISWPGCMMRALTDTHLGFLNSNSTTGSPSSVVISHLVGFRFLLQGELQNPDEILQLYIKKHLGPNGSCPLSLYNYSLLSKSNIEVPKRLVSKENGYKFSKKLEWYLQRDLAKLVNEDPPAILLLFEPKGQPEDKGNDFHIQSKKNMCVGCGEGNHYLRHRIIPSCYWTHFPRHLKSYYDILLLCVDCHEKAHFFAEKYKNKVASDYGIPLFVHKVVNSSGGVSRDGNGREKNP